MRLDGLAWFVLEVLDADLDVLLHDSASGIAIADDVLQMIRLLEVLRESALGVEDNVHQLLSLGVPLPRLGEDLGEVVDRELHGAFPSFLWSFDD